MFKNFKDFIFKKEKNLDERIITILGKKFSYNRNSIKRNKISFRTKIKNAVIQGGNKIEAGTIITGVAKKSITIGRGVDIATDVHIVASAEKARISIGESVTIGPWSLIIGEGNINIEKHVKIAPHVKIYSSNHGYEDITRPIKYQPNEAKDVIIGAETWLCVNAIILPGVKIGKHCVVGAGSVVTKDIPDYAVVVGNPAKIVKRYNPATQSWERVKD